MYVYTMRYEIKLQKVALEIFIFLSNLTMVPFRIYF